MEALPTEAVRYNLDTFRRLFRIIMATLSADRCDAVLLLHDRAL